LNDTRTFLESHKASTVSISEDEFILDTIGSWSGTLLREQLGSRGALRRTTLFREVCFSDLLFLSRLEFGKIRYICLTLIFYFLFRWNML